MGVIKGDSSSFDYGPPGLKFPEIPRLFRVPGF